MWSASMIGVDCYFYPYDSDREGLWCRTAIPPRKANLVVYVLLGFEVFAAKVRRLGKYKTGKSSLYLNRLDDVDIEALTEIIVNSVGIMKERYLIGAKACIAAEGADFHPPE
jgi:hypothetical protein